MPKKWTRLASTLLLVGLALPASATEYGAWQLIDTKTVKDFTPDAKIPTDLYGTWKLVDVQYSKSFLADMDIPAVNRYGNWQLVDATMDRRWMGDQFIGKEDLGSAEVGRDLVSDQVDKLTYLKNDESKVFGDPITKLLNPVSKEVPLGQYKRRDSGRPVSTLVEQYRIDTTYDKEVSHPWTQTHIYAEKAKHTKTFNVTVDKKSKLTFKDPITGANIVDYDISLSKRQEVNATDYADNGVLSYVKDSGTVVDPLVKVTQAGPVKEREVGKTAESAASAASSVGTSAVAYSSNSQAGGDLKKVGYAGEQERKALAVDKVVLSKKKDKKDEREAAAEAKAAVAKVNGAIAVATPKPVALIAPVANAVYPAPAVGAAVQNELNQLDGTNDWKDLGEAIKKASSKDDLIAIGLALLAGKGGDIKSSEAGMSEKQIRERVAKLADASDSSKAQFVADMLDVQTDALTGRWGPNLEKFFKGKEVPADSRMRFFTEIGMRPVISSNSGLDWFGNRTVVYTLKLGNLQLGPYTTTYNVYGW